VLTEQAADPNAEPRYDVSNHSLVLFDRGDEIVVQASDEGIRFLLLSGKPIEEPVAWYGPIVMNTQEQLRQAVAELRGQLHQASLIENCFTRIANIHLSAGYR
jgi:redox-sensitive bicupin YhaK (pirin superfamily)